MKKDQERKPFEIGLVMAGAVSAGAYTAGVIDFLFQALEEWHMAKERGKDVPTHEVKLKVISGASAGGMTGAIIASMLNDDFTPVTNLAEKKGRKKTKRNKLYDSWVEQVDISNMLNNNDLRVKDGRVKSLLDSSVLEQIAERAIDFSSKKEWRPYISDPLHLYLTVTNLPGVPYNIQFNGDSKKGYTIIQHSDYVHFASSLKDPKLKEAEWLNAADSRHPNWDSLKIVALATGAFPGGLAPRIIDRRFNDYNFREWPIPQRPEETNGKTKCIDMEPIQPSWPKNDRKSYQYLSVDGGVMDNEPLELARRKLAGGDNFNPRKPEHVHRATIMIDPFPSGEKKIFIPKEKLKHYDIFDVFTHLFGSLVSQARFKPDEIMLANSEQTYSRFLIAPTRLNPDKNEEEKAKYPIASGFLSGFGGFISKKFRMHDFQLGRRNCQKFLKEYFAIPLENVPDNEVFKNTNYEASVVERDGKDYVPFIPLTGTARKEVQLISWDDILIKHKKLKRLRREITNRTSVVINRVIDQKLDNTLTKGALKIFARLNREKMVNWIMEKIKEDLETYELIDK